MSGEEKTTGEVFIGRVVLFILAVLTIIAALAWNDYVKLVLREKVNDSAILKTHLIFAIIITGILILAIALFAWLFGNISGI